MTLPFKLISGEGTIIAVISAPSLIISVVVLAALILVPFLYPTGARRGLIPEAVGAGVNIIKIMIIACGLTFFALWPLVSPTDVSHLFCFVISIPMFLVFFHVLLQLYYKAFPTCVSRGWTVPFLLSAMSIGMLLLSLSSVLAVGGAIGISLHAIEEAARRRLGNTIAAWTLGGDSTERISEERGDIYPPRYKDKVS